MAFGQLCAPALIYIVFSITQVTMDSLKGMHNVAFVKLFISILFSCSSSDNTILVANSGETQGSYYHIKYMSEYGEDYHFQIDSILQKVDSSLSIYKSYSLISKLNSGKQIKTDDLFNTVLKERFSRFISKSFTLYLNSSFFDKT